MNGKCLQLASDYYWQFDHKQMNASFQHLKSIS